MTLFSNFQSVEDTPVINGVKVDEIALNSSRSRRRRDSQGSPKHQRRSIISENGGPDEFRRVSSAATTRELTKSQNREQTVQLRKKGRDTDGLSSGDKTENKRGSSIVLDVDSILDVLITGNEDSDLKPNILSTKHTPARRNTPSPILKVDSADPPLQPKKSGTLETVVTRSSKLVRTGADESKRKDTDKTTTTTTMSSTSTSSQISDKRPPIAPPTKKMSSPGRLRGFDSSGTRNSTSSPVEDKSGQPPPRSPDPKEEVKDIYKQSSSSSSRKVYPLTNGTSKTAEEDDSYVSYRSRTRSNAISKTDTHQYSPRMSKIEKIADEEEPPPSPRLREKSKRRSHIDSITEMRPERSGSWNRMRQLVNSKQLGMFYHNRRSQALDHDSLDEAESRFSSDRGSSVERSDSSTSAPHSPTVLSPRSRESRGFSPSIKSPLAAKRQGFDEAHKALADIREREENQSKTAKTSATSLAPPTRMEQEEEEPQVCNAYTYMLLIKLI